MIGARVRMSDFEKMIGELYDSANRFFKDGVNPSAFRLGAKSAAEKIWKDHVISLQSQLQASEQRVKELETRIEKKNKLCDTALEQLERLRNHLTK